MVHCCSFNQMDLTPLSSNMCSRDFLKYQFLGSKILDQNQEDCELAQLTLASDFTEKYR